MAWFDPFFWTRFGPWRSILVNVKNVSPLLVQKNELGPVAFERKVVTQTTQHRKLKHQRLIEMERQHRVKQMSNGYVFTVIAVSLH